MIEALDLTNALNWRGIVIHHSASPDGATRDWPGIVHYHTSYRIDYNIVTKEEFERRLKLADGKVFQTPWKAVGYHAGLELVDGAVQVCPGRPLSMIGAHAGVKGASGRFNEEYIGLCAVGNYDPAPPPEAIWQAAIALTLELMDKFSIPVSHVIGHREVFDKLGIPRQKSCPGNRWSMEAFRDELKSKKEAKIG